MKATPSYRNLAALTLVELLVVLSIVAVLSTVALRSVVGVLADKKYDANVLQMEEIEAAIVGDGDTVGFLGDIGRLPIAVGDDGATNFSQLAELWDRSLTRKVPANLIDPLLPEYAINTPAGDAEVRLGTGWRGPYMNLGINRNDLTDGFANRLFLLEADGITEADDADEFETIQSRGFNGEPNGLGTYDEDLEILFDEDSIQTPVTVKVETENGQIEETDGRYVVVRVYGADGSGGLHTVDQDEFDFDDPPNPTQVIDREFTFLDLPHGPKVFRAYQLTDDPDEEDLIVGPPTPSSPPHGSHTATRKSRAKHIVVDRFTGTVTLILFPDSIIP